jgi:hypothetical protein
VLIVTVLLISAAASIAYAISYQASMNLVGEHTRAGRSAAAAAAAAARGEVELQLAADPLGFTSSVLSLEPPRRCLAGPSQGESFSAGDLWPSSCGAAWSYSLPSSDWTGTRVEITPPSALDGALTLTTRVRIGAGAEALEAARYLPQGAGRFSWASTGTVSLSSPGPSSSVALEGALYARTATGAPGNDVSIDGIVAAETLTSPAQTAGVSWFSSNPDAGSPAQQDIRALQPAPLTTSHLGSLTTSLMNLGCPRATPSEIRGSATHLCLAPGATVILSNGESAVIPASARSFLAIPTETGEVQAWYATTAPGLGAASPLLCATPPSTCSLPSHTSGLVATSSHPGHSSFWSAGQIGTLAAPVNGVLAAQGQLYVGRCDAYATGACAPLGGGSSPGVTFGSDLTVVADTVVLGSPVHTAPGADLAFAASGQVHLAYWSRPSSGSSVINAHLLGAAGVAAFPALLSSSGASDPNWDNSLVISGSVTGTALTLGLAGWRTVEYTPTDSSFSAPPWFSATSWGWERVSLEPAPTSPEGVSPASVPGLVLWFDANDETTQTLTAGELASWSDKSLRGNDATTTAPGNPEVVAAPAGSQLSFSGAPTSLLTNSAPRTGTGAMTLVAVVSAGSGPVVSWGSGPNARTLSLVSGAPRYTNGSSAVSAPSPLGTGLHVVTVTVSLTGGVALYVNGAEVATGTVPSDTPAGSASIGSLSGSYLTGSIAEIVVYNQVLTPLENNRLTGHLIAKWGA